MLAALDAVMAGSTLAPQERDDVHAQVSAYLANAAEHLRNAD